MVKTRKTPIDWRLGALRFFLGVFCAVLLVRLFAVQIWQHGYYSALAAIRHDVSSILQPERGRILVKDGSRDFYPIAVNRESQNLILSPRDVADDAAVAKALSDLTKIDITQISADLSQKAKRYLVLKTNLSDEEIQAVADLKKRGVLPKLGVWLESETKRYYPEGPLLSSVLGFVGIAQDNKTGLYGLEKTFNEVLAGRPGNLEAAADPKGRLIAGTSRRLEPAINGSTLVLTIERPIQVEAEKVLDETIAKFGADGGQVIVADPKTGAILAAASAPAFNPNEYNKVKDVKVFNNPAVQSRFEPGSVIKPITVAAALQTGAVQYDDTYVDTGKVVLDGYTIENSDKKSYGRQTIPQILEKSLNTGAVFVQQKLGKDKLLEFFKNFGFDQKTGIALPGEIAGDLRNLNIKNDINYATASFGQGISVTPIELLQAYQAIANGGQMKKLQIISEVQKPDGSREVVQPQDIRRVISDKAAVQVSSMLVDVVENGHGKRAQVPGYYIAGKTGTAQVPLENARGYDPNKTIGSFVGFGPVENPAFVMLVKIDNPKGVKFAESTAAPAFGTIAKFILDYLQVPSTRTAP